MGGHKICSDPISEQRICKRDTFKIIPFTSDHDKIILFRFFKVLLVDYTRESVKMENKTLSAEIWRHLNVTCLPNVVRSYWKL